MVKDAKVLAALPPRDAGEERGETSPWAEDLPEDWNAARKLLTQYSKIPEDEVADHVRAVRQKAWALNPYPCIGRFRFLELGLSGHPSYKTALSILQSSTDSLALDLGCCFAQDLRVLTAAGIASSRLYGADLRLGYTDIGYELFRDRTFSQFTFLEGDILAPKGSAAAGGLDTLDGKMSVLNASSFLHLFSWEDSITALVRMIGFLKPAGDVMVLGRQMGSVEPGNLSSRFGQGGTRFAFDSETFVQLWDEAGRITGTTWDVDVTMQPVKGRIARPSTRLLYYTAERK